MAPFESGRFVVEEIVFLTLLLGEFDLLFFKI